MMLQTQYARLIMSPSCESQSTGCLGKISNVYTKTPAVTDFKMTWMAWEAMTAVRQKSYILVVSSVS